MNNPHNTDPYDTSGGLPAFDSIYAAYGRELLWYCRRHVASADDAEEIAHDCFIRLWMARHTLRDPESVRSYLFTTARHAIVDHYRRQANSIVTRLQSEAYEHIAENSNASTRLETDELRQHIMAAIAALPPTQREAINLVRIQGHDIDEAAQTLGLSRQTIKNALTSAAKTLRAALQKHLAAAAVLSAGIHVYLTSCCHQ